MIITLMEMLQNLKVTGKYLFFFQKKKCFFFFFCVKIVVFYFHRKLKFFFVLQILKEVSALIQKKCFFKQTNKNNATSSILRVHIRFIPFKHREWRKKTLPIQLSQMALARFQRILLRFWIRH